LKENKQSSNKKAGNRNILFFLIDAILVIALHFVAGIKVCIAGERLTVVLWAGYGKDKRT
jgi:spermidine/putrescine-binding protein